MTIYHHCSSLTQLPFDYEPDLWTDFSHANCYEYLLNFQNPIRKNLTVGSLIGKEFMPNQSNSELICILKEEMSLLGFTVQETDNSNHLAMQKMKFYVSRSVCGDYHFYRLDSNGIWSHKFSYFNPTNLDFDGHIITLPELACKTDLNLGYYLLGLKNR